MEKEAIKTIVSASQISTFRACQRKWGWRYVANIREEPNKSAELGSAVHAVLESYLTGGPVDFSSVAGEIAMSALSHLPEPNSGDVEQAFYFEKEGIGYQGYKDFRRGKLPGPGTSTEVWDHKTTSDFKWAKSSEDLQTDPQAVLYAVDEFVSDPGLEHVDLYWSYMRTRGAKKSQLVHLRMVPEQAAKEFQGLHVDAKKIESILQSSVDVADKAEYVLGLKPSPDHCDAFGGCPNKGRCNLSPEERNPFKGLGENMATTEEIMAKLRAASGAQPAPPAVPINPPESALPAPPEPAAPTEVPPAKKAGRPKKETAPKPPEGPTVYLDCMPLGGEHTMFDDIVREAAKRIHAEHAVADYRFIQFHSGAVLLATVQTLLDETAPLSIVVRDSSTPEALICSSALVSRAGLVVVGT